MDAPILSACERILAEIEEAEVSASLDRVEPRGTLRLNVPLTFGFREVAPALAEFSKLYPSVAVDLGLADRYVDLIDEGWDLAIRIGRLQDSSLVARKSRPAGSSCAPLPPICETAAFPGCRTTSGAIIASATLSDPSQRQPLALR